MKGPSHPRLYNHKFTYVLEKNMAQRRSKLKLEKRKNVKVQESRCDLTRS